MKRSIRIARRFVRFLLHGGFVQRNEGRYADGGDSLYRVISGNRRHHVAVSLFGGIRKPFRIPKGSAHRFSKI